MYLGWYGKCGETDCEQKFSLKTNSNIATVYKFTGGTYVSYTQGAADFMNAFITLECGNGYWIVLKPDPNEGSVDIPDFVDITYSMIIWCDYTTQVNHLTEQILYWSNTAWGETFKFMVTADNANFETTNGVGEDRTVRSTFDMTLKGRLLPKDVNHQSNQKKTLSPGKVIWDTETVNNINNIPNNANGTGSNSTTNYQNLF